MTVLGLFTSLSTIAFKNILPQKSQKLFLNA